MPILHIRVAKWWGFRLKTAEIFFIYEGLNLKKVDGAQTMRFLDQFFGRGPWWTHPGRVCKHEHVLNDFRHRELFTLANVANMGK